MGQKLKIAGWISMGVVAGALTTVSLQTVARGALAPLPLEELQQLAAVFGMVKTDYVEPVDEKKLITDAISGMVASLDPHSQYFDKKSFKEFREGTTGRFVGVGIEITQEDGLVKVVSPIEGSPADRAGLKPNDLITKIDDTAVKGLTLNEAVKHMRGEPNTKVHADHLPQGREPHLPGDHHARGNQDPVGQGQGDRARLRLDPPVASSRNARWTTSCARSTRSTSRTPSSRAWCWTCATTRAACWTRRWPSRPPSCPRT